MIGIGYASLRCAAFNSDLAPLKRVHPRIVMETLGHSQISLTMNTYTHSVRTLQPDAAARLDELLGVRLAVKTKRLLAGASAIANQREQSEALVSQTFASWNHIVGWLRRLEGLRGAA